MERLKSLRNERKILQKEVASYLGIDRTTYVKYETGASEPSIEILRKLATFFSVSVDYLVGENEKHTENNRPITDAELKFALFDGDQNITDAQFEEVKRFAQFIRERDRRDK